MKRKTATLLSALAIGVGTSVAAIPAHADDLSDLKALIGELKTQLNEQKAQVKDLKAQLNSLNAQVSDQKKQVTDQSAQVQNQTATLQKVEAQQQALEQKQVAAAPAEPKPETKEGYIAVPGTNTQIKIGGYVKLDMVDDVSSKIGKDTATDFTAIPLSGSQESHRSGQLNVTAKETRLGLTALTNSNAIGDIKTVVEGDFYSSGSTANGSNSVIRLRHAYVSAAGFTAGQTWSTFMDLDTAGPETLDFNGPVGYAFVRQPQLRYTRALPTGSLDVAIESPKGDMSSTTNDLDKAPDLIARYTVDPSWGHFAIAGMGRYLSSDSGLSGQHASKMVYGVMAGLGIKTFGKDMLAFQTVDGDGVGRYMNQGQGVSAILINNSNLKPINIWGGTVSYTHFWTDTLRSNVAYGYDHFTTPAGDSLEPIKSLSSIHANLIWSPWDSTDVGIEYIYGHIETSAPVTDSGTGYSATSGSASRVQGSVKYTF